MITICQLATVLIVINADASCPKNAKPLGSFDLSTNYGQHMVQIICRDECVDRRLHDKIRREQAEALPQLLKKWDKEVPDWRDRRGVDDLYLDEVFKKGWKKNPELASWYKRKPLTNDEVKRLLKHIEDTPELIIRDPEIVKRFGRDDRGFLDNLLQSYWQR